jgi:hypothetical protein
MFFGRRANRLSNSERLLAVRVGREKLAAAGGNSVEFERLVKSDARTQAIDPALIALFIQIAIAVFKYYMSRNASASAIADETDAQLLKKVA